MVKYEKDTFPQTNHHLIEDNIENDKNSETLINYLNKTKFPFADYLILFVNVPLFIKIKYIFLK